ncbi:Holliday junction branch migration DNA helicase RuvB [Patescibacteria group bacterium]|nr:Holliday junction branch migration DNA helicase RuvB [Patescibacteria group bacterium]MBU4353083.1 Holliday junction branch migration DNA helicase RuvB [Patescibacteria group bacterium]MBU4477186.1 Holliday junction branch migration DNA helicase RuvB [Patescibacteria group bacterium]MCG2699107.1 Holliday junction branch migration DNA helicase RuvB [Candidatus Parcubacteria bacterium]
MSSPKNNTVKEDVILDQTLRPQKWEEYIGQELIKKNLKISIAAAQERNEPIDHVLFYGPAGLGKTTLAHIIAKELNAQMKVTSGPAIERVGDLASILTNLSPGDVLFVDEAHRLNKMIEEILYPAMESRSLDIIIGKGPSARSIQLELPPFTLIAATTRIALLSSPLRSRFAGGIFRLDFYSQEEIKKIILRSAKILGAEIKEDAANEIAQRSRFTPRIANNLLKRCRDYAQLYNKSVIDVQITKKTLELLEIDEIGLVSHDRQLLEILIDKFGGGPAGLQTLAAATTEEAETIEDVYEPYLIRVGFMERTPRGRVATRHAYNHLKKFDARKKNNPEEDAQKHLL